MFILILFFAQSGSLILRNQVDIREEVCYYTRNKERFAP